MALIDCVSWSPENNRTLAYRYPEENLSTYTQLIVSESQEAVLFSKGQIIGKFGPGKHTLDTENLPLLRNFFGIPFGGKNPFQAVVYFVNKAEPPTIPWLTKGFRTYDPSYNAQIPVLAKGRMGVRVDNAEEFLIKIVGTGRSFTVEDLSNVLWGELTTRLNSTLSSFMQHNGVGILNITAHLFDFSCMMREPIAEFFERYGVTLLSYNIDSIDIDDTTNEGRDIIRAVTARTTQNIAGYSWQQQQAFDTMNNAVNNGGEMGMLGMALMMGGGMGGGMGAGMMQQAQMNPINNPNAMMGGFGQGQTGGMNAVPREVFCSCCAKKYPSTSKFCPHCGDPYNPCPKCGTDNNPKARRCISCGTMLQQAAAAPTSVGMAGVCSRCGNPVSPTIKFCTNCGNKLR